MENDLLEGFARYLEPWAAPVRDGANHVFHRLRFRGKWAPEESRSLNCLRIG